MLAKYFVYIITVKMDIDQRRSNEHVRVYIRVYVHVRAHTTAGEGPHSAGDLVATVAPPVILHRIRHSLYTTMC